jgi:hypothetical protein
MSEIITKINKYLLSKITLYAQIFQNGFQGIGTEEITVIQDSSQAVVKRYMDSSRTGQFNFSYYTKSIDQLKARKQLDEILLALDFKNFEEIDEITGIRCEIVNTTFFRNKTQKNEWVFVGALSLEYYIK